MQTIEETIRKSKELSLKYQKFKEERQKEKEEQKETEKRIERTIALLKNTISDVNSVTAQIDNFQKSFSNAIDALAGIASGGMQEDVFLQKEYEPAKEGTLKDAYEMIRGAKRIFCLTGAGMSAASGLKTFRGTGGYWTGSQQEKDPKKILNWNYFSKNQEEGWKWLIEFYNAKTKVKPNQGHYSLEKIRRYCLEKGKSFDIVTQNIDNLHTQTSDEIDVLEKTSNLNIKFSKNSKKHDHPTPETYCFQIHGNITKLRCSTCTQQSSKLTTFPSNFPVPSPSPYTPPSCPTCKSLLRPHIMMFDQSYDQTINSSQTLKTLFNQCDLLLVIGTALQTGMANYLVNQAKSLNLKIIQINIQTVIKTGNVWSIKQKSEVFLNQLEKELVNS